MRGLNAVQYLAFAPPGPHHSLPLARPAQSPPLPFFSRPTDSGWRPNP